MPQLKSEQYPVCSLDSGGFKPEPAVFVVFGATGDLSHRKIFPALFDLFLGGILLEDLLMVGFARKELDHKKFREGLRQGCASILNIELFPKPPEARSARNLWPEWDFVLRTSSSHKEAPGGDCREWCINTRSFEGDEQGNVRALNAVRVEWSEPDASGRRTMTEIPGSEMRIECDLVLLAMGFVQPEADAFAADLKVEMEKNRFGLGIKADSAYATGVPGVFAAGDARRGQSLVVWAIYEGREAARAMDLHLTGRTHLAARDCQGYEEVRLAPAQS